MLECVRGKKEVMYTAYKQMKIPTLVEDRSVWLKQHSICHFSRQIILTLTYEVLGEHFTSKTLHKNYTKYSRSSTKY